VNLSPGRFRPSSDPSWTVIKMTHIAWDVETDSGSLRGGVLTCFDLSNFAEYSRFYVGWAASEQHSSELHDSSLP